ncbi:hypothetical protein [Enterococcus sp. BWR-S5]|uniref:hypothetical protein n=1 Tax=Enterococcus sp. BWR-S5 TaxID=2787714 RepID=UPI00192154B4|nr:hypothetical protein [Enterococcus sp. BWR-S5]MBL1227253.1 hypothetical protein [Enterococcus sp. BWR-S5]
MEYDYFLQPIIETAEKLGLTFEEIIEAITSLHVLTKHDYEYIGTYLADHSEVYEDLESALESMVPRGSLTAILESNTEEFLKHNAMVILRSEKVVRLTSC